MLGNSLFVSTLSATKNVFLFTALHFCEELSFVVKISFVCDGNTCM